MKRYRIAIYIRLSKEDDKGKEESNSITMQRALLERFIEEHLVEEREDGYVIFEFCDDGYTGTNFKRPAMTEMLEMAKAQKIDCIIVKDFSRFARDYIELGSYLEQIFPFMGIRFISVNDGYDSKDYQGSIADIDVDFKNLLYDLYSKDLSEKVRSSLTARKEKGQYVSANTPFGYRKDPNDRHKLIVADEEAEIVKQIFALTVDGNTSVQIAKLFNENNVKTPIQYKIESGETSRKPKGKKFLWNSSTICQILRNEVYIGNIVQKKTTKDYVGGKNHLNPREDWLVTYNHHEPVIDNEVFEWVQNGRGGKRPPQHNETHPLIGKLVCASCGKNLQYRRGLNPYFTCSHRYYNGLEHCVEKVNGMFVEEYILFMMQGKQQENGELDIIKQGTLADIDREIIEMKEKRQTLERKIHSLKQKNFEAYQNYADGKADNFQSNEQMQHLEEELIKLNNSVGEKETAYIKLRFDRNGVGRGSHIAVLSKEMVERYIEKVVIYDEQNMEIQWRQQSTRKYFAVD